MDNTAQDNVADFVEHYIRREVKYATEDGDRMQAYSLALLLSQYMAGNVDVTIDQGVILWQLTAEEGEDMPSIDNH